MALSLYQAVVPGLRQILVGVQGLVDKAEIYCSEHGLAAQEIIQARLAEDMHPFAFQVKSAVVHSIGAIEGVRRGFFSPDRTTPPESFVALRQKVSEGLEGLAGLDPAELDSFVGKDVRFEIGDSFRLDFIAENFLFSFSMPNFYFHATTAYDILRMKGLPLGKIDFLGQMAVKG